MLVAQDSCMSTQTSEITEREQNDGNHQFCVFKATVGTLTAERFQ